MRIICNILIILAFVIVPGVVVGDLNDSKGKNHVNIGGSRVG